MSSGASGPPANGSLPRSWPRIMEGARSSSMAKEVIYSSSDKDYDLGHDKTQQAWTGERKNAKIASGLWQ